MSSKLHEPHDNLKIKTIVKKIDDIIYQMYEINEGERRCIEAWFGEEQRPLLEGICQRKTFAEPTNNLIRINYEVPEWETTCETLETRY